MTEARVYLVGAGPGDPGLLTVRALDLLQSADVVVYDRLVSAQILARIPAGVSQLYVGKAPGKHSLPQAEINELLVSLARGNRTIVRLKGGDPFIFGRGGEEAECLARHGIAFERGNFGAVLVSQPPGGCQLFRGQVNARHPRSAPGHPSRDIAGTAVQLDSVKPVISPGSNCRSLSGSSQMP